MELYLSIASVLLALALGAISPGPSFVFVARTAVAISRRDGLAAALGMGVGGVVFSVLVLAGLRAALLAVPVLFIGLKIAGSLYLVYLAVRIWRGARSPLAGTEGAETVRRTPGGSFVLGLLTQLSNPKAVVVYGSIFAAMLPRELPRTVALALPVMVFAIEAGWYAVVTLALSSASPRRLYLRCKTGIDRTVGGVLAMLGLKLLFAARSAP